ncbi:MAG: hypothetical protein ACRDN1_26030 [Trebonia sp.]
MTCQVCSAARSAAPSATVNHPVALLMKLVNCSRWTWLSWATAARRNALPRRRRIRYMTGGSSSHHHHHHHEEGGSGRGMRAVDASIPSLSTSSSPSSRAP